jgi:predicted nucleic acid-binding protein
MSITALFDSSAVILYFNDALSAESFAMMKQAIDDETGAISVVTRAEVLAWPSHTAQSLQEATVGMAGFAQLAVDVAVADEAARIRRQTNLKLPDALIAATAMLHGLPVVTANARDFERVEQLKVLRF